MRNQWSPYCSKASVQLAQKKQVHKNLTTSESSNTPKGATSLSSCIQTIWHDWKKKVSKSSTKQNQHILGGGWQGIHFKSMQFDVWNNSLLSNRGEIHVLSRKPTREPPRNPNPSKRWRWSWQRKSCPFVWSHKSLGKQGSKNIESNPRHQFFSPAKKIHATFW